VLIEELIGPDTINTMPPATMDAFREHGNLRASLEEDLRGARDVMETLDRLEISIDEITAKVLDDGIISSQMLWTSYWRRLLASAPPRITPVKLV
jgi:transaldolase / glucose-6-phosphate isomerase